MNTEESGIACYFSTSASSNVSIQKYVFYNAYTQKCFVFFQPRKSDAYTSSYACLLLLFFIKKDYCQRFNSVVTLYNRRQLVGTTVVCLSLSLMLQSLVTVTRTRHRPTSSSSLIGGFSRFSSYRSPFTRGTPARFVSAAPSQRRRNDSSRNSSTSSSSSRQNSQKQHRHIRKKSHIPRLTMMNAQDSLDAATTTSTSNKNNDGGNTATPTETTEEQHARLTKDLEKVGFLYSSSWKVFCLIFIHHGLVSALVSVRGLVCVDARVCTFDYAKYYSCQYMHPFLSLV